MIKKFYLFLITFFCFFNSTYLFASEFGLSYANLIIAKDPSNLHGYRVALTYQPTCLIKKHFEVYFDAGYSHWWLNYSTPYRNVSIFSIAPYLRYYIVKNFCVSPYIEASIGLSYINKTQIGNRRQGIHFTFQDQLGIGLSYGKERKLFTTLSALHYSNGSMSRHNAGITVPLYLTIGYRF